MSFADLSIWTFIMVFATLLASMLVASILKRFIPFLQKTLIPVSVLGGIILLIISTIVYFAAGNYLFNLPVYGDGDGRRKNGHAGAGNDHLPLSGHRVYCFGHARFQEEVHEKARGRDLRLGRDDGQRIPYSGVCGTHHHHHCGLGDRHGRHDQRGGHSGLRLASDRAPGQALNYGRIYENQYGFAGGANFGLTVAALGFLVACFGGVIYINVMRKKGQIKIDTSVRRSTLADYEAENELPAVLLH